jgi:predicted ArsR family transcriptional regulator
MGGALLFRSVNLDGIENLSQRSRRTGLLSARFRCTRRDQTLQPMSAIMNDASEIAISHLQRRKIEGRVLIPFIQTLKEKLGESTMREVLDATIGKLAAGDGAAWAEKYGQTTASLRAVAKELWASGGAMDIQVLSESDDRLDFNVTRCRYAEFYKELGLSDIGYRVHCNRDHAMIVGFNDELELSRSGTIMNGAACCDFRYRKKAAEPLSEPQ